MPAVEHGPDRKGDGGNVDCRRRHQAGRGRLVATDREHDTVEGIAVQHLHETEIGEIAIEAGRGPLAGLLDRVDRKFDGDAAGFANPFADPLRERQVMAIAGREIRARLGDADDGLAGLQLSEGEAVIEVALQVQCGEIRVGRIVEPGARAQAARAHFLDPRFFLVYSIRRTPMSMTLNIAAAAAASSPASIASTIAA